MRMAVINPAKPLNIGFDARMVFYRQAGIGQYILNLLREMAQLRDPRFHLTVYQSRKEKSPPQQWLGYEMHSRKLWTPPHHRYEQYALPFEIALGSPQVLHSPDFIQPFFRPIRRGILPARAASVITIHDLAFKQFPHLLTEESARYYGQVERAAQNAQRIIAVSQNTAKDVINYLKASTEKVRVVYEAAHPLYCPLTPPEMEKLGKYGAHVVAEKLRNKGVREDEQFILFVSTIEPRKNLPTLLQAYRGIVDQLGENAPRLALAGREGWLFRDIYHEALDLGLGDKLIWLGGVSTEELLWLYNRAACLAMPSLYEGFGLPPLEALACGTPALVADTSSLPEVVGAAGVILPSQEPLVWKDALLELWQNRVLRKRETLEKGAAQAARFSWRKAAQETLEIYLEAYKT